VAVVLVNQKTLLELEELEVTELLVLGLVL
jgi:hypothetical protein